MTSPKLSASLGEVLRSRPFWRWSWAAGPARLPPMMAAVAVTTAASLVRHDPNSGGTVASAYVAGMLLLTPVSARLAERWGVRRVVQLQALASALAWIGFSVVIALGAPYLLWHLAALLAGGTLAGSAGLLRSTLSDAAEPRQMRVSSSLDATVIELLVVAAPMLVTLGLSVDLLGTTGVVAAISALAVLSLRSLPGPSQRSPTMATLPAPLLTLRRPLWAWGWVGFALGLTLGVVEIGAVSLVSRTGLQVADAWVVFAVLTAASVLGGLIDTATAAPGHQDHRPRTLMFVGIMISGCLVMLLGTTLPEILLGVALLGLPAAPLFSARSLRTEAVTTPSERPLAFTRVFALQSIGFAVAGLLLAGVGQQWSLTAAMLVLVATTIGVVNTDRPAPHS
jgi:MFS family permease